MGSSIQHRNKATTTLPRALGVILAAALTLPFCNGTHYVGILVESTPSSVEGDPFFRGAMRGCRKAIWELESSGHLSPGGVVCDYIYTDTANDGTVTKAATNASMAHVIGSGFLWLDPITRQSDIFHNMTFSVVDTDVSDEFTNVQGLVFADDEGGFLAGVVAGLSTRVRIVGCLPGIPYPPLQRFRNSFLNGVLYVCPDCIVLGKYIDTFTDLELAVNATKEVIEGGIDVLFGAAGIASTAAIEYAAEKSVSVIGVDNDARLLTFTDPNAPRSQFLLTSAEKRVDTAVYLSLKDRFGTGVVSPPSAAGFVGGTKLVDARLGGIGLTECASTRACSIYAEPISVQDTSAAGGCPVLRSMLRGDRIIQIERKVQLGELQTGVDRGTGYLSILTANGGGWTELRPFGFRPPALTGHAAAIASDNCMVLFGGEGVGGVISGDVFELNYDEYEWRRIAHSASGWPMARAQHTFVAVMNLLVLYGGSPVAAGNSSGSPLGDVWTYNATSKLWTQRPTSGVTTPTARAYHVATAIGSRMYVFGGINTGLALNNELWELDVLSWTWHRLDPATSVRPPASRRGVMIALPSRNELYLFGGQSTTKRTEDGLYAFDLDTLTWTRKSPSGVAPSGASELSGVAIGNRLFFFGGLSLVGSDSSTGASATSIIYDAEDDMWTTVGAKNLPIPIYSHVAVSFNQSAKPNACVYHTPLEFLSICKPAPLPIILVFGGSDINGATQSLYMMMSPTKMIDSGPISSGSPSSNNTVKIVTPAVLCTAFALVCLSLIAYRWRRGTSAARDWLIKLEDIEIMSQLGKGSFGLVYKGRWRGTIVAVKTIESDAWVVSRLGINSSGSGPDEAPHRKSIHQMRLEQGAQTLMVSMRKVEHPSASLSRSGPVRIPDTISEHDSGGDGSENGTVHAQTAVHPHAGRRRNGKTDRSRQREAVGALTGEIQMMCALRHPNIVLFMGACLEPGSMAVVMEYMGNGSLVDLFGDEEMRWDWRFRLELAIDAASGMTYLHSATPPILHLDLKSPNLLIDNRMRLKVADFGLSQMKSVVSSSKNRTGELVVGTLLWMAPELLRCQLAGESVSHEYLTEKCDVFAFGVVLWEVMARQLPYGGGDLLSNPASFSDKLCNIGMRPEPVPETCPEWVSLMCACWDDSPSLRPSFEDIVACLEDIRTRCQSWPDPAIPLLYAGSAEYDHPPAGGSDGLEAAPPPVTDAAHSEGGEEAHRSADE
eukprot:Opistho-2@5439